MTTQQFRVLVFCLAVTGVAAPVFAQSEPAAELSAGYQFLNFSVEGENESMPKGWYFDVAGNVTPMLGVVFQVGGNYKTFDQSLSFGGVSTTATADVKVHLFLGGVRMNVRSNPRVVPFAQALVGGINGSVKASASTTIPGLPPQTFSIDDSGTNVALQLGGGLNVGWTETVGIRVGADYLRVFEEDAGGNLFRFHVGIVIARN